MRPALTCGRPAGPTVNMTWIWPPRRSVIAKGMVLYGTCTICTPAICLKSSVARCGGVPLPPGPWCSPPAFLPEGREGPDGAQLKALRALNGGAALVRILQTAADHVRALENL